MEMMVTTGAIGCAKLQSNSFHFHFASAFAATSCSHVTAPSSAEWSRNRSSSANLVSGQDSTMWIIVCTSPHWHLSVGAMCHLCRLAAQRPCPVRKRFSIDHVGRRRLKPGSLMVVGSEIRFLLVTEFDCQSSFHLDATSTGLVSDHIGFPDFRRGGGWLTKFWCTGQSGFISTVCSNLSQVCHWVIVDCNGMYAR